MSLHKSPLAVQDNNTYHLSASIQLSSWIVYSLSNPDVDKQPVSDKPMRVKHVWVESLSWLFTSKNLLGRILKGSTEKNSVYRSSAAPQRCKALLVV